MFRRVASLGHQASENHQPMSPSPGDEPQPPESRAVGGLAGVFRLGGGKLAKSPPPIPSPSADDRADARIHPHVARGLPRDQMELYRQLKSGATLTERVAAANSLRYAIADFPFNPVLEIWEAGKDLIETTKPTAARVAGWELLTKCVQYTSSTDRERKNFFDTLTAQANPEDFHLQLAALEDLTNHGRNVSGFYYDIFPLLTSWLQEWYKVVKAARRQATRSGNKPSKGKALAIGEDKNFSQLFAFLKDVIKFNFKFASDNVVGKLLAILLKICMNTSVEEDLRSCINVIDALVTFGTIPKDRLRDCIQVLSSIHCLVPTLQKDAWHILGNICRSHHGQSTVRILLDVLRRLPVPLSEGKERDAVREVRGALSVLKKLLSKSTEKGYPAVPLALLVDGLSIISRIGHTRISIESLKLINSLFEDPRGNINPIVIEEHWSPLFSVAAACAEKSIRTPPTNPDSSRPMAKDDLENEDSVAYQLRILVGQVERMLVQKRTDFVQKDECMNFLTEVQQALPDSAATLVIDHFKESRSCFPSDVEWKKNLSLVLEGFYLDRSRLPLTRLQSLELVTEVYSFLTLLQDLVEEEEDIGLVQRVLSGLPEESETLVLQQTVAFLVGVADTAEPERFADILDSFKKVVSKEMATLPQTNASATKPGPTQEQGVYCANQSLSNVVTKGYVQIFIRSMNTDASKATQSFTALIHIARSNSCQLDARLTAMKLLFRLRADFKHRVYLTSLIENEGLAGTLYRTEASLARKLAEDAAQSARLSRVEHTGSRTSRGISFTHGQVGDRGPARLPHNHKQAPYQGQRLWAVPDADALPESPPSIPSQQLLSFKEKRSDTESQDAIAILDMSSWLDALLSLFHQGCDWEVYSFVLVHLPAQLSNHPIFDGATTHIQEVRRVFCEMIRMNSFQEPPSATGLRRPDVGNCLFHSLIMIMSYHRHFQKVDEDEIVRTFMHGIADKTAKTCIHAFSVCCHELPMSVSKSLVTILQKMSQVITQPFVAMHILEFLACLSRLPSLYSNFREDEYRIVFAICFRYLQYVRERKHSARGSYASEPPTPGVSAPSHMDLGTQQHANDDLPQYVYALAYHVITFWFLAVKMPERPNYIPWIARNLFIDFDGSANNEEQAQITLDFMQRVAFSDAIDSAEDPLFKPQFFGETQHRRWIIGNSIVTIRQAKETGWAEITRRYPSGTSSFAIRVEFPPPVVYEAPQAADLLAWEGRFKQGTTIFPSHLLMQLLAPMPQIHDPALRPIPLPEDDAVDRAIRTFDRSPTVDGHKIGVIYIGEGQVDEIEILANTIGGPDYLEFLRGLGSLTKLKGAPFNTQGLDRVSDADGRYTYCWRDRVTEILFHVITQMPTNLDHDPRCTQKKKHIGNDYVNIVFNDSGLPFRFDMFPSQFNYVYIVITPTPRLSFVSAREGSGRRQEENNQSSPFFMVQVMSQPGFPEISPAAEPKLVSLKALPGFVRLLAINASVFSHVWANREGGEHISPWRNRLQEINRLRERYGPKLYPSPSPPPSSLGGAVTGGVLTANQGQPENSRPVSGVRDSFSSLRRSSVATFFTSGSADQALQSHRSSMLSTATTENTEIMPNGAEALVESVDFSKWT
ncbi:tuberous sclerosis 2 protein [Podospora aff. communis PSN243]|uniref:Tuberous sclerosis 2 protein n=1 Tax=Podospora aff. communis PSN243 TaxID=3040156 RepID=A0AAV9GWS4_9PEZI|nr:tuberous sclerosis 2 protein [Podospora aff. communis PSN243]